MMEQNEKPRRKKTGEADPVYSDKDVKLKLGYLLFFQHEKEKESQY